jgi:parvulin-like peptidyl-prolyl isomerase
MKESTVRKTVVLVGGILVAGLWAGRSFAQQAPTPAAPSGQAKAPTTTPPSPAQLGRKPNVPPDKVVLKVGDMNVTAAQFNSFLDTLPPPVRMRAEVDGGRAAADQYATGLALEQAALRDHLDQQPKFATQMEMARMQTLAKLEYEKLQQEVKATPDEIAKYYNDHPLEYDMMDVRRILVHYKKDNADPDEVGIPVKDAKARVEAYSKELRAGKTPEEIEKEFKEAEDAMIDSEPMPVNMSQFQEEWRPVVSKLKIGEISEPLDWQGEGYVAIQLLKREHKELRDASRGIETQLKRQRLQAAMADVKKKAAIWMDEEGYFKRPTPPPPAPNASKPATTPKSPAPAPKQ